MIELFNWLKEEIELKNLDKHKIALNDVFLMIIGKCKGEPYLDQLLPCIDINYNSDNTTVQK